MLTPFYRELGSTGIRVSPLGLGTVKFGRNQGVKYPQGFELPDDHTARALLDQAKAGGINLLDTAPAYGIAEERLGPLLRQDRHDWIICSKAGEEFVEGQSHFDFSPAHLRRSVERSLKRLGTDVIDILLIHSDGHDMQIIREFGALETLNEFKRQGLIRASGMSTKTVDGGIAALEQSDLAMVTLNLKEQQELPVMEFATRHGKGILVKKAFGSGHMVTAGGKTETGEMDPVYESLKLAFSQPAVSSVITGTLNSQHLAENIQKACQALTDCASLCDNQ